MADRTRDRPSTHTMRTLLTLTAWELVRPLIKRSGVFLLARFWAWETRRELAADRNRKARQ